MRGEHFYGHLSTQRKRVAKAVHPAERHGVPAIGRIVKLFVGQGHGYLRLANDREVYFHRSDIQPGTDFNTLAVGEILTFELLNDMVSGARAIHVRR